MEAHPAYDAFWQSQALDKLLAAKGPDRADDVGAGAVGPGRYVGRDPLIQGPAGQGRGAGDELPGDGAVVSLADQPAGARDRAAFSWATDTALDWRRDVLLPFFNQYLKTDGKPAPTPPVFIYDTGADHWDRLAAFPASCEQGCSVPSKPLYLREGGGAIVYRARRRAQG